MSTLHTKSTLLEQVSGMLFSLPPGARSETLWHSLGFVPASELLEFSATGPIRAALATYWEQTFNEAVPISRLRTRLLAAKPEELSLISALDDAKTPAEIERNLAALLSRLADRSSDTQLSLLELAAQSTPPVVNAPRENRPGIVHDLSELVRLGHRFSTIYADPPWPYENEASRGAAVRHYPTMALEAILAEPVAALAKNDAHLHLWTTNSFLAQALQVMHAWGFTFKSCLIWIKPDLGLGNYWRVSHEFLLLGVRGNLRFLDRAQPSWVLAHRSVHSRKPGMVRLLIERVSPGPYLELYGREELPHSDWTVYGNDVERRLC